MSISKVAKLAGVSSSTVSRVINNHPRVAPETVQSVKKAMKELGYVPSDRRPGPKPSARQRVGTGNEVPQQGVRPFGKVPRPAEHVGGECDADTANQLRRRPTFGLRWMLGDVEIFEDRSQRAVESLREFRRLVRGIPVKLLHGVG